MNQAGHSPDIGSVVPGGSAATQQDLAALEAQLGRKPRGVVGVAARCKCGNPLVVITEPRLADGSPFPTTFYLTSPELVRACSTLEAEQLMEMYNEQLRDDATLRDAYVIAHEDYLQRRANLGSVPEIEGISAGGMPARVKCLHALIGHALAAGSGVNPIGDAALEEIAARGWWSQQECGCSK